VLKSHIQNGFEYELWELNPIINVIHKTATMKNIKLNVFNLLKELRKSSYEFIPNWSNLNYWFPKEFISVLSDDEIKYIFLIPLIKTTKYFSYCDEKLHKLYKSKYSKRKIEKLLKEDWENQFYYMLEKEINILLKKIYEYNLLKPKEVNYKIKSGIDTIEEKLDSEVNIPITSPPYLQAQEYIRSTKLELFWLGYEESYIRNLKSTMNLEIK